jgi:hypothetical protein
MMSGTLLLQIFAEVFPGGNFFDPDFRDLIILRQACRIPTHISS